MLSHLSDNYILSSQPLFAPPTNPFFFFFWEKDRCKGKLRGKISMFYTQVCEPYQSTPLPSTFLFKLILKRKNTTWLFHRGNKLLDTRCFKESKDFWVLLFHSKVFPPRSNLELIYLVSEKCEFHEKFPMEVLHAGYSCNRWTPKELATPTVLQPSGPLYG